MMIKELTQCYSAGRRAFQYDLPLRANPYAKKTLKRKAWRLGYIGLPQRLLGA